ncbi:MAG: CPBP family intramembrane metalloprotease, partial [Anaerolineae bacterium]|nr:CPBP family intramembrane metalloprotease [Anaerolineae bacterium]
IWYFFILLYMPVLLLAALGVSFVINGRLPVLANLAEWTSLPILFAQVIFVGGPLMDELGWRGFFQPALEKQLGKLYAGLLTAFTASLWLIPFFAVNHLPVVEGTLLTFGIHMLCAFVYERSRGSLLPTVLLQGVVRATLLFFPFLPGAVESRLPLQAAAALVLAAALAVTLMVNQDRLPRFAPLQRSAQPHPLAAD